jgi:tRNA U34 5-carboxymethylaminomethyl modifying GTPase MnmE/TrmE
LELKNFLSKAQEELKFKDLQIISLEQKLGKVFRNIILIGRTGNGKSTIANILTDGEKFEEGKYGVSQTSDIQAEEFEIKGISYKIIDTIGIGDTKLTNEEVLRKIIEAARTVRFGLNQVLFVVSGKFTREEILTYELLQKAIFDQDVAKYTAIVRTHFPYFEDEAETQKDLKKMSENSKELAEIINSCNKIIHVDNHPRLPEDRKRSQKILFSHLEKCDKVYQPKNLVELNDKINVPMTNIESLEKQLETLKEEIVREGEKPELLEQKQTLLEKIKQARKEAENLLSQHLKEKDIK